jgi:sulfoxide reductase catalytic subunit YedY
MVGHAQAGQAPQGLADLPNVKKSSYVPDAELDPANSYAHITNYNNYYEFGTRKTDPAQYAGRLTTRPWTVKIDGMVGKPGDYAIDDLIKSNQLEERIYRHRCVEGWSYVVPWVGFPLKPLIDKAQPTSQAKYVEFTTLMRASEMPGLQTAGIPFPYIEGLRMDEALNLTLVVVGLREDAAEPERRAIRFMFPGNAASRAASRSFASSSRQAAHDTWAVQTPNEYGFFANVIDVDHPRWTQATERRIGGSRGARR